MLANELLADEAYAHEKLPGGPLDSPDDEETKAMKIKKLQSRND